jgi:hypothetical protein
MQLRRRRIRHRSLAFDEKQAWPAAHSQAYGNSLEQLIGVFFGVSEIISGAANTGYLEADLPI